MNDLDLGSVRAERDRLRAENARLLVLLETGAIAADKLRRVEDAAYELCPADPQTTCVDTHAEYVIRLLLQRGVTL